MRTVAAAALCAALVLLCVFYVDIPVQRVVVAHARFVRLFQALASPSLLPLPLGCLWLVLRVSPRIRHSAIDPLWLRMSLATLGAATAKDELKWLFGRPWPESWEHYGVYAFKPFATGWLYGAFPSGHTSYATAPLCVLWVMVPRWRPLYAAVLAGVMAGLVGGNYHFVGDLVGGFFTGLAAAAVTLALLPPAPAPAPAPAQAGVP